MTETATTTQKVAPRLKQRYADEIKGSLQEQFGYANVMQIPGIVKVVVNMGVGDAARDAKLINGAVADLSLITGQKPEIRKARKSIAQFKLREGMPIGCHVTLRGDRMWEFLDRLLSLALPRIREALSLSEAGATVPDVVRVRYILPRRDDFPPCWPVLKQYFGEVRPAATMIEAGLSDPRMKIEVEVTARRRA